MDTGRKSVPMKESITIQDRFNTVSISIGLLCGRGIIAFESRHSSPHWALSRRKNARV
jgi:hypothetical protein